MAQGRRIWYQVFQNFINSLTPRRLLGELKGKDYLGNKYYETPNSSYGGRQRRWYYPPDGQEESEIPTEWESWLRHKRKVPPTEEEIQLNRLKMEKVKENVKRLEMQKNKTDKVQESASSQISFPQYKEYSTEPFREQKKESS